MLSWGNATSGRQGRRWIIIICGGPSRVAQMANIQACQLVLNSIDAVKRFHYSVMIISYIYIHVYENLMIQFFPHYNLMGTNFLMTQFMAY